MQPFSLLLGLGALTGLLLAGWRAPKKETIRYIDAGVLTLVGALLGSRALFVMVNFSYYQTHPGEIFQVWLGGLSSIGALVGGILAVFILAIGLRIPVGVLADMLLPLAGALAITAWLGCWVDRCGYGVPSNAWWAMPGRDEWGVLVTRVPVQLMGAGLTLLLIWILDWAGKRLPAQGLSASIGLFGLSAVEFSLSYLRADSTPMWNGLRLEAWGSIGLMIFSIVTVVVLLLGVKFKKQGNPRRKDSISGR
jgi:phosphatidylglycerol:prolipoprotein diacylglycerol transferase